MQMCKPYAVHRNSFMKKHEEASLEESETFFLDVM